MGAGAGEEWASLPVADTCGFRGKGCDCAVDGRISRAGLTVRLASGAAEVAADAEGSGLVGGLSALDTLVLLEVLTRELNRDAASPYEEVEEASETEAAAVLWGSWPACAEAAAAPLVPVGCTLWA